MTVPGKGVPKPGTTGGQPVSPAPAGSKPDDLSNIGRR